MNTSQDWKFKYSLPEPVKGKVVELSFAEVEEVLLDNLRSGKKDRLAALWELARFYSHSKQHEKALDYLRQVMALQPDIEDKAATVLAMGQTMEHVDDYAGAARYYREAFAFEPVHTRTWYFINNNLGYSLNRLGNFAEGETYCRAAIKIEPRLPNGFKNLGIALRGQGRFAEAAECFVKATQADASDARSVKLLEELLVEHLGLGIKFGPQLELCRKAVEVANEQRARAPQPVIERGWRKWLFMAGTRIAAWWRGMRK